MVFALSDSVSKDISFWPSLKLADTSGYPCLAMFLGEATAKSVSIKPPTTKLIDFLSEYGFQRNENMSPGLLWTQLIQTCPGQAQLQIQKSNILNQQHGTCANQSFQSAFGFLLYPHLDRNELLKVMRSTIFTLEGSRFDISPELVPLELMDIF